MHGPMKATCTTRSNTAGSETTFEPGISESSSMKCPACDCDVLLMSSNVDEPASKKQQMNPASQKQWPLLTGLASAPAHRCNLMPVAFFSQHTSQGVCSKIQTRMPKKQSV